MCLRLIGALSLIATLGACTAAQPGAQRAASAEPRQLREISPGPADGSARYEGLIASYAEENGVPLPLAHAVVQLESGYNARARGRGTVGLMQIKPATARGIGYRGSTDALYDPATNLRWGMKYLGGAYKLGGGETCATALRYQGGHRATRMSAASRRYCAELKRIMARGSG
ncbi:MAG: transglycosylase SLT domain-containing protein [Rhizobiales bacterium]|nr:transglycosylase SLT domain-containing protein [Hyphomicrobiales bacterium]